MYIKRSYKTPSVEQIYNYKGHVFSWNMLFPQQPIGSIMTLTCLHENSALAQQPPPAPCIFFEKPSIAAQVWNFFVGLNPYSNGPSRSAHVRECLQKNLGHQAFDSRRPPRKEKNTTGKQHFTVGKH